LDPLRKNLYLKKIPAGTEDLMVIRREGRKVLSKEI